VFPPLPLVEPIPAQLLASREQLTVEGGQHWYCGGPWQRCQPEHLRELGEVDGNEWQRFMRWRDAGFPSTYFTDDDSTSTPVDIVPAFKRDLRAVRGIERLCSHRLAELRLNHPHLFDEPDAWVADRVRAIADRSRGGQPCPR